MGGRGCGAAGPGAEGRDAAAEPEWAGRYAYPYKRRGTVSLLAACDIATGKVMGSCRQTRTGDDSVAFMGRVATSRCSRRRVRELTRAGCRKVSWRGDPLREGLGTPARAGVWAASGHLRSGRGPAPEPRALERPTEWSIPTGRSRSAGSRGANAFHGDAYRPPDDAGGRVCVGAHPDLTASGCRTH